MAMALAFVLPILGLGLSRADAQTGIAFVQVNSTVPQSAAAAVVLPFTGAQTVGNLNVVVVGWNDSTAKVQSLVDSSGNAYVLAAGPTVRLGFGSQASTTRRTSLAAAAGANVSQ